MNERDIDGITRDVIGLAMRIHEALGPGLLESVYETVLAGKLIELGYRVDRQRPIDVEFEGMTFPSACKIDILVDERLVVEIKSVDQVHPSHAKQVLTYIRLLKQPVGLLLNFGGATLKEGIRRLVNNH